METDEREKLVGVIGLHILHYHVFHIVDKKTFKLLWELHKKVRINGFKFTLLWFLAGSVYLLWRIKTDDEWHYLQAHREWYYRCLCM